MFSTKIRDEGRKNERNDNRMNKYTGWEINGAEEREQNKDKAGIKSWKK
jgi:hypothetical protein